MWKGRRAVKIGFVSLCIVCLICLPISGLAFEIPGFGNGKEAAVPQDDKSASLKMYSVQRSVTEKLQITPQNLTCDKGAFESAFLLYDKDENSFNRNENLTWMTLDAGEKQALIKIRYLVYANEALATSALGTKFLVSNNNRDFTDIATIEGNENGEITEGWHEIQLSGFGEYRYFKIELPAGANLAEVEWISDEGVRLLENEKGVHFQLTAFDAAWQIEGTVVFAAYNAENVMKCAAVKTFSFSPQGNTEVAYDLTAYQPEAGDWYRVEVFDENGNCALAQPLNYRYTKASPVFAVANVFGNDMLLQADAPVEVWGSAPIGSTVTVTLQNVTTGKKYTGEQKVNDVQGYCIDLGSFPAGGIYAMTVENGAEEIEFKDITFGDLWLFAGQSNMDYFMLTGEDTKAFLESGEGKKRMDNGKIRLLNLWNKGIEGAPAAVDGLPISSWEPAWQMMRTDTVSYCSAVSAFFSTAIQERYNVPVGVLNVAVGDTEINRWLPRGRYGIFEGTDGSLYHNRIAPLSKLKIKGILYYQGEADEYRTHLTTEAYRDAFVGLINHYRSIWGKELPFYWAQLTRYKADESSIREAQRQALEKVEIPRNTGMISLIDQFGAFESGKGNCRTDIHPDGKQTVAERFLRFAMRDVYGEKDLVVQGPLYQSMTIEGNKIRLHFVCNGNLGVLPPEQYADSEGMEYIKREKKDIKKPQEFSVAGSDGVFYPAEAELDGSDVLVWSDRVKKPVNARYAWGAYPEMPNLTDESGLPAAVFTTEFDR